MGALELVAVAVRAIAVALVVAAGGVALTHWAVRRRYLNPFSALSRGVRRLSDPLLRPIESRIMRRGGNPQDGSLWLVGLAVAAGLLLVVMTRWAAGLMMTLLSLRHSTPIGAIKIVLSLAIGAVMTALLIRVLGQWLGASPYSRLMRIVGTMTNWLVEPIRRRLPPFGMIDASPVVAYFVLLLLRELVWALLG